MPNATHTPPDAQLKAVLKEYLENGIDDYNPAGGTAVDIPGYVGTAALVYTTMAPVQVFLDDVPSKNAAGQKPPAAGPDIVIYSHPSQDMSPASEALQEMWEIPMGVDLTLPPDTDATVLQVMWDSLFLLLTAQLHADESEPDTIAFLAQRLDFLADAEEIKINVLDVLKFRQNEPVHQVAEMGGGITRSIGFTVIASGKE